jgi:hypothetical protein
MIRRLIGIVIALVAAWLGLAASAQAMPSVPAASSQFCTHDDPVTGSQSFTPTPERGRPSVQHHTRTYDAADRPTHGASVRPGDATKPAAYDYDDTATFARVARGGGVTEVRAGGARSGPLVVEFWRVAAEGATPLIKAGTAGGETAGKAFPQSVKDAALAENPGTCVYCRMETSTPRIDHAIPKSRGGNATLDNAQTT